jgi:hypothetical protein
MRAEGAFRILEMVDAAGHAPELAVDTPSWVPDYLSHEGKRKTTIQRSNFSSLSLDPRTPELQRRARALGSFYIGEKGHVLQVSGYKIGTCSHVSSSFQVSEMSAKELWQDVVFENLNRVRKHYECCQDELRVSGEDNYSFTYSFAGPVLKNSEQVSNFEIVLGMGHEHNITMKEMWQDTPMEALDSYSILINIHARRIMFRFVPVVTYLSDGPASSEAREKSFGIGTDETQKGGELYIIPGSEIPFILRPHEGKHRLVGQAFIGSLRESTWLWDKIEARDINLEVVYLV